jgi:hypothetical protein
VSDRDLSTITLTVGDHDDGDDGMCLMEAVAWFAGEPWTSSPECASLLLGTFGRGLNDVLPDETRQRLVPLIPRIVGTVDDGLNLTRSYLALDWLVRTHTPAWLDLAGHQVDARALRGLQPITGRLSAQLAETPVLVAWKAACAAWSAAGRGYIPRVSVSQCSAGIAASRTAGMASRDAAITPAFAGYAAETATIASELATDRAAAEASSIEAKTAAVERRLAPTVLALQDSAIDLFTAMIRPEVTP